MNFDFSEDQKLLQKTARDYLEEHAPLTACREVLESKQSYSAELWKGAAELGWLGAVIPEEYGGAGFGYLELAVIAEEVGRSLAPIPFSSTVYLVGEAILQGGSAAQKEKYLPRLASGDCIGAFALAEAPGDSALDSLTTTLNGGKLSGTKIPVQDGDIAHLAVVVTQAGELALVDLEGKGVRRETLTSFDPSRSIAKIDFDGAAAEVLEGGAELLERVLNRAAVLVAFEQLGGAARTFEMTHEYTMGRYAFGRPVASFQGVKHRLADLWCEIELARSNCYYGAWALSNDDPELGIAACLSRVSASESFDLAAREMIQLHGGVGYTWEYDCHLFYRRAKLLSLALGSPAHWKDLLIDRIEARDGAA